MQRFWDFKSKDECLQSGILPSIAYGFKRCSLKHKIGPQEKFCNNHPGCRKVWDSGKMVVKFIGYDARASYRSDKVFLWDLAYPKYSKWYPLMEWGWGLEDCIREIGAAGCPSPVNLPVFLAQHEDGGNHRPKGAAPGFVPARNRPEG